jgi:predicted ABC-type ATPase
LASNCQAVAAKYFGYIDLRSMLQEIQAFADQRATFAFESTLSGRGYIGWLSEMKKRGYKIHIFYLWVRSVNLAISRVRERVSRGGHDIAEPVTRRRFDRSIRNFMADYRQMADSWSLFNNSEDTPSVIAWRMGKDIRIADTSLYTEIEKRLGVL